jgi:hypothetical protein
MLQANRELFHWGGGGEETHSVFRVIAAPTHTQAKKLVDFWDARPDDGIVMGRDMPSRRIASLLSNIMICAPTDGGADWIVRHSGEAVENRFGGDIKGRQLSEVFDAADFRRRHEMLRTVVGQHRPTIIDTVLTRGAVELMHLETVLLPVFSADRAQKWILAGLFYFR